MVTSSWYHVLPDDNAEFILEHWRFGLNYDGSDKHDINY